MDGGDRGIGLTYALGNRGYYVAAIRRAFGLVASRRCWPCGAPRMEVPGQWRWVVECTSPGCLSFAVWSPVREAGTAAMTIEG
jgi:hypothetical protein